MAQPEPRSPKGNRSPNGGPVEPSFNWRGMVLLAIAIGLLGAAYVFKGGPMGNVKDVPYPEFVKLLDEDKIVKEKGVELVSEPGSATDFVRGWIKSSQAGTPPEP